MSKQAETLPSDPKELLQYLETTLAQSKADRERSMQKRRMTLAGTICLLLVLAFGALYFLFSLLHTMPRTTQVSARSSQIAFIGHAGC